MYFQKPFLYPTCHPPIPAAHQQTLLLFPGAPQWVVELSPRCHKATKPTGRYYCKASKWHPAAALIESSRPPATPPALKFVRCSGSRGEAIAWIRISSWAVCAATDSMLVGRKGYHAVPAKQDSADPPLSLRIIQSPFVRYTRTVCRTPWLM